MVQTGDPALKPGGMKPAVDTAAYRYTIPAEIRYPRHFHKKGALAAARMGDDVNPEKASSGTQFYIVTGKTYTDVYKRQMSFSVMAVWSAATVSCKSFTACASALPAVNSLMSSCNAA